MPVLLIHGGAGGDGPWGGPTDLDKGRIDCMEIVLGEVGRSLESGKIDSLQAVTIAVQVLENEPLFNAGCGSVLDAEGNISMDASLMRGWDGAAGACAGITNVKNPIALARTILDGGEVVMLIGEGAEKLARESELEIVDEEWLKTDLRKAQWKMWQSTKGKPGSTDEVDGAMKAVLELDFETSHTGLGTVGAVALDKDGNLSAATSTGGMTGKLPGRISDTALIGAGTWADQKVAISCTGVGEAYIRTAAAKHFADLCELTDMSLIEISEKVLSDVSPIGGRGGLIAVNSDGDIAMPFQTTMMYRGYWKDGAVCVSIGPDS